MYKIIGKRLMDFVLSVIGLLILCIPMLIIAIAIKMESKGPVFFRQKRIGKNGRIFTIFKFRTMVVGAYEMGGIVTSSDDTRITKVGAVLRRTSLDELPQMFNILRGEMSIIGPRPILPEEFEPYKKSKEICKRNTVLPGMFCTIDVIDRAPERDFQMKMDADYAKNVNFITDIKTFLGVISVVVSGKNVYKEEKRDQFLNASHKKASKEGFSDK